MALSASLHEADIIFQPEPVAPFAVGEVVIPNNINSLERAFEDEPDVAHLFYTIRG